MTYYVRSDIMGNFNFKSSKIFFFLVDDASLKQTLPEKFQLMLTELGIEKTINCLIALVENR